jgi:alcohol dehydrogenase class IV
VCRYSEVARLLTGDGEASAEDGVAWVRALCAELAVPPLGSYGVTEEDLPLLIEKASASSSMKGNPLALEREELQHVLAAAL